MPSPVASAVKFLVDFGLLDVVLPFLLLFSVIYALLDKTKVLGEEGGEPKKNLNITVAFVISFLAVAASSVVGIIQRFAQISAFVIIIAVLGAVFWVFARGELSGRWVPWVVGGLALAVIAAYSLEAWKLIQLNLADSFVLPVALMLIAAFVVIWIILREEKEEKPRVPASR